MKLFKSLSKNSKNFILTHDDLHDRNFFSLCPAIKNKQTKGKKKINPRENKSLPKTNNTTKNKIKFTKGFPK